MPEYVYRREDGTTFSIKQHFTEDALTIDPKTGQKVVRLVQPPGVIFRGSGFYVNDSRDASKRNLNGNGSSSNGNGSNGHSDNGKNSEVSGQSETKKETESAGADT